MALLPKETKFFDMYDELVSQLMEASNLLVALETDYYILPLVVEDMKELEAKADTICHRIITALSTEQIKVTETLADIRHFVHKLDNLIDYLENAIFSLHAYEIRELPTIVGEFFQLIREVFNEIYIGVKHLRHLRKKTKEIGECAIRINTLEDKADSLHRGFRTVIMRSDASDRDIMKLREIVGALEETMDQAEDVANLLETFVLKGEI